MSGKRGRGSRIGNHGSKDRGSGASDGVHGRDNGRGTRGLGPAGLLRTRLFRCRETRSINVEYSDDGKVYALDTKGKRSPKAFKTFDEYEKFITDNPQFHKNSYSYDKDGKDYNVDFKKTTIKEE